MGKLLDEFSARVRFNVALDYILEEQSKSIEIG